jgi:hypothetical protein
MIDLSRLNKFRLTYALKKYKLILPFKKNQYFN